MHSPQNATREPFQLVTLGGREGTDRNLLLEWVCESYRGRQLKVLPSEVVVVTAESSFEWKTSLGKPPTRFILYIIKIIILLKFVPTFFVILLRRCVSVSFTCMSACLMIVGDSLGNLHCVPCVHISRIINIDLYTTLNLGLRYCGWWIERVWRMFLQV